MTNLTTNRNKVTTAPTDIIQDLLMCPAELMHWLTIGAIELFVLGADADSKLPDLFTNAMTPVANAWYLEDGELEEALSKVENQRQATANHREGEEYPLMVDRERLLQDHSGKELLSVLYTLIDTMVWLPQQEDRQAVASLLYYLKEFWCIEECLNT